MLEICDVINRKSINDVSLILINPVSLHTFSADFLRLQEQGIVITGNIDK
jgi:hypothetical protein